MKNANNKEINTKGITNKGITNKGIITAITTITLLLIICFSITGTVRSQGKNESKIETQYRSQMEDDYMMRIRELLESEHMRNSGITMTKVIYENGQIAYEMTIHNRVIDRMSDAEQQKLRGQLEKISFPDTQSSVSHQFLTL
ncbi:MAG: hypothetical protein PHE02_13920 [Lachnospiraceae bacterium]|nr:hypothetical protein [Lachnospiraceae bacterium]